MSGFELSSDRLVLRPHDESDADFMLVLDADPEVTRFTGDGPLPDRAAALALIRDLRRQFTDRKLGRFMVLDRATRERLGFCGLKADPVEPMTADLGYRLLRRWWGQGLAAEAARLCLRYGFEELGLARITAEVERGNVRSVRLLEKLGFRLETDPAAGVATWALARPAAR